MLNDLLEIMKNTPKTSIYHTPDDMISAEVVDQLIAVLEGTWTREELAFFQGISHDALTLKFDKLLLIVPTTMTELEKQPPSTKALVCDLLKRVAHV